MADGIYGIGQGNTSGVNGGYLPPKKDNDIDEKKDQNPAANANTEHKEVDPDEVMAFLANQNYFMPVGTPAARVKSENANDSELEERIAGYMEKFEQIYAVVEKEFGIMSAPSVMNAVMDNLMGMA